MAPPALMEELVEEVLLRIPPNDPASLVRAALVSKEWCRIVSGPGFRRRFRELHRTPPVLGLICLLNGEEYHWISRFVPTSSCLPLVHQCDSFPLDVRHGRVVFCNLSWLGCLRVWDPVTKELWDLPALPFIEFNRWNAAVLCASHGICDHLDCHGGPFLLVVVSSDSEKMLVHVYSSETGSWSERTYGVRSLTSFKKVPAALVGNALYFLGGMHCISSGKSIIRYELDTRNISVIQSPPKSIGCGTTLTTEDGGLGVATLEDSKLYRWSMETVIEGNARWTQIGVIQLQTLLPITVAFADDVVSFAHGVGVFVIGTDEGLFSIDLKSHRVRKLCNEACGYSGIRHVIPYMSFYTPALRF